MREEFGAKEIISQCPLPLDCDSLSITSETTSLHSWHRRVLAETHTVIVHPSDSLSTRAGPCLKDLPCLQNYIRLNTYREPNGSSCGLGILPSSSIASTPTTTSPIGPPPDHPPPPLPLPDSSRYKRNDLRSPPPLPPRASFRPLEASISLRSSTPRDGDRVSNESVVSTLRDAIIRNGRQGHKKTNSLDRGLTLAKSMKAGPFPPPSNKSNSLTRQEPDDDEEECARNTAAEGVILQITTKVIGDQSITVRSHFHQIDIVLGRI
ncbi:unnamed protein product [Strongylus vulgaris]|uniref:Uncharacterized protein n=1 Tax=Strongylus vulgaris TaxID=40348 RepID=A0A3P7L5Z2_STRVU|nr:unnamed protein product [Strongylus vulgaris]